MTGSRTVSLKEAKVADSSREPRDVLADLFGRLGRRDQEGQAGEGGLDLGGIGEQFTEFLSMPLDLTTLLIERSTDMAELVLATLAEAGYVVVKGTTPL